MEDAVAECALLYCECRRRYGSTVTNDAWLMSLFKTMVVTRFCDLSVKDSKSRGLFSEHQVTGYVESWTRDESDELQLELGAEAELAKDMAACLETKIGGTSKELRQVLYVMFNAPAEVVEALHLEGNTPKKFFRKVATTLGISNNRAAGLIQELQQVLR